MVFVSPRQQLLLNRYPINTSTLKTLGTVSLRPVLYKYDNSSIVWSHPSVTG